jgi:hypothetical protein
MPRFVILTHDHPYLHWDFLLEHGDGCRTWRLLTDPSLSSLEIDAEALPDHRLLYLDYEGPVSSDRGSVTRWDTGTFEWQVNNSEFCEVILAGQRWQGIVRIKLIKGLIWKWTRAD